MVTATQTEVRIEWRLNGQVGARTTDLDDLRDHVARYGPRGGSDYCYTVHVPGGPIWLAAGRIHWADPRFAPGASRDWWIDGDLSDLVAYADRMLAGETFERIYETA